MEQPDLPDSGHRAEREEADGALYAFDLDLDADRDGSGRTKVAVAKDRADARGWGPQTSAASRHLPEPPARFTDA
ncbi:hypothetical protein ACWD0J_31790 [Streptomyces sp. NPDC003011]